MDVSFHPRASATFSLALAVRSGTAPITHVAIADLAQGRLCSIASWESVNPSDVFVDDERSIVAFDSTALYVSIAGGVIQKGPRLPIRTVIFVGGGSSKKIFATTDSRGPSQLFQDIGQAIYDISTPEQPRQIAAFGGSLLGTLADGTLVLSTVLGVGTNTTLVIRSVNTDGGTREIARITGVRGTIGVRSAPRPEVLVAAYAGPQDAVIAVDLASGERRQIATIPFVGAVAFRKSHEGFVTASSKDDQIVGTDAPSFGVVKAVTQLHWSPDDAYLAVKSSGAEFHVLASDGAAILDVAMSGGRGDIWRAGWVRPR